LAIATAHQREAALHEADGSITQIVRFPGVIRDAFLAEQRFGDRTISAAGCTSIIVDQSSTPGTLHRVSPVPLPAITKQLRLFERRGLVRRSVYAEVPPRVEYSATDLALTLRGTLDPLAEWMRIHGINLRR
jgi:hypothetical protein